MTSTLVVIHLGSALNMRVSLKPFREEYGSHEEYLERLKTGFGKYDTSIVLASERDSLPFALPGNVQLIRYKTTANADPVIEALKERGITNVDVGGEYLWWYLETPTGKRITISGCVNSLSRQLAQHYPTTIKGDLCYPRKDPDPALKRYDGVIVRIMRMPENPEHISGIIELSDELYEPYYAIVFYS